MTLALRWAAMRSEPFKSCFIGCEGQSLQDCPQAPTLEEREVPKRNRTEVLVC